MVNGFLKFVRLICTAEGMVTVDAPSLNGGVCRQPRSIGWRLNTKYAKAIDGYELDAPLV